MSSARVLLNTQYATLGQSATARYVRALVRHLPACGSQLDFTLFDYLWRLRPYLRTPGLPRENYRALLWPVPPRVGSWLFRHPWSAHLTGRYDVLHLPDDSWIRARARRTVSTLHMAPPLQRPEFFPPEYNAFVRGWVRDVRDTQDMLITVSEHLRQLVIADFQFPPERVAAIPLGIDEEFRQPVEPAAGPPQILYVGWVRAAKNVRAVCQTFVRLASMFPDLQLKLVGKVEVAPETLHEWLSHDSAAISRTFCVGQIPVAGQQLARTYASSSVLLFPSYAEGWTSPPLEAMACGLPVVCSNCSSLPETVGDAALLADPDDHDALAAAVQSVLQDSELRAGLVQRGRQRAALFTWQRMAQQTYQLYSELAS